MEKDWLRKKTGPGNADHMESRLSGMNDGYTDEYIEEQIRI